MLGGPSKPQRALLLPPAAFSVMDAWNPQRSTHQVPYWMVITVKHCAQAVDTSGTAPFHIGSPAYPMESHIELHGIP